MKTSVWSRRDSTIKKHKCSSASTSLSRQEYRLNVCGMSCDGDINELCREMVLSKKKLRQTAFYLRSTAVS